jgi:hypothetical protein
MRKMNKLFTKRHRPLEISYLETLAAQARNSRSRSRSKHTERAG